MDWNVLRGQRGKGWLSSSLFEEFIAFFKKMPQIDSEDDKNPKFSNFQSFYAFFVEVSTNFEDWKLLKGQQGKSWSSSGIL